MLTLLLTVLSLQATPAQSPPDIRNFLQVTPEFCTGGQPRVEHFARLKADGVKAVLNLRQPTEHRAEEEQQAVAAAGLKYFNIPVELSESIGRRRRPVPDDHRRSREPADVHSLHRRDQGRGVLDDSSSPSRRHEHRRRARGSEEGGIPRGTAPRPVRASLHHRTKVSNSQPNSHSKESFNNGVKIVPTSLGMLRPIVRPFSLGWGSWELSF